MLDPSRIRATLPKTPRFVFCAVVSVVFAPTTARAQCLEGCVAIHVLEGEAAGDQFGWKSNSIGDVTGDGIDEFVITAPTNDAGGSNAGRAYVYSGADATEHFRVTGNVAGGQLGIDAGRAGDVDADGTFDLIVGAPSAGTGRAVLYSGVDGAVLHTFLGDQNGDQFGFRVAGGGDVNGDGVDDLVIGAINHDSAGSDAGRVYLHAGPDYSLICAIDGQSSGDHFGTALALIGDINQDGREDVLIGAGDAGPGGGGRAYVYSYDGEKCNLVYTLDPGPGAIDFGRLFADGGRDVNNDQTPDFYVADFNANRAHLYSGSDGALIRVMTGDGSGGFGIGEMIDDVDGDGRADLILAAWVFGGAGFNQAGKTYVYSGRDGSVLRSFTHDVPGATFGFDANGLGDVNADGRGDFLVTAAWDLDNRGRAYLIAGDVNPMTPGDGDGDGDVDLFDYEAFGGCVTGPAGPTGCAAFDLDFDDDVDLPDFGGLQRAFTGSCGVGISEQPEDLSACLGSAVAFHLTAQGPDLTYQWRHDGLILPGATETTLVIDPVSPGDAGHYSASAANDCAIANSLDAELSIGAFPEFLVHPESVVACLGDPAFFAIEAQGAEPLTYQWRFDDADIPGATLTTFMIAAIEEDDLGTYLCAVTDDCALNVESDSAELVLAPDAVITAHPIGGEFCVGDNVFLFVSSSGGASFQWFKDGVAIPGETDFFLSLLNVSPDESGVYVVAVFGACNQIESKPATVLVIDCAVQP